jgi:hypothetical protein
MTIGSTGLSSKASRIGVPQGFYPSPFFDVASTYTPSKIQDLFVWCQYYHLTNPIVSAVVHKLATFSVSEIEAVSEDENVRKRVSDLATSLNLREFIISMNLDFFAYGNAFASVIQPVLKTIVCRTCKRGEPITNRHYTWKGNQFHQNCPFCFAQGVATVEEHPLTAPELASFVRWQPSNIKIRRIGLSDRQREYDLRVPRYLENQINMGNRKIVETTPTVFLEAVRLRRAVTMSSAEIFHMSRQGISRGDTDDTLWGVPLIAPVMKDTFLYTVLRKTQEAHSMEHVLPLRMLSPAITTAGNNIYEMGSVKEWVKSVTDHVDRWKADINHIAVSAMPVSYQRVGGEGAYTSLQQDIRGLAETIIAGMGVPVGFFFGELHYSGGSVNLKALEVEFGAIRNYDNAFLAFALGKLLATSGTAEIHARMKPVKMAEDMQRQAMLANLVSQGHVSTGTLLSDLGLDAGKEQERLTTEVNERRQRLIQEASNQAEAQGQAKVITARYDLQVNQMMQDQQNRLAQEQAQAQQDQAQQDQAQQDQAVQPMQEESVVNPAQQDRMAAKQSLVAERQETSRQLKVASQARQAMSQLYALDGGSRDAFMVKLLSQNPEVYYRVIDLQQGNVQGMSAGAVPSTAWTPPAMRN